ncbi:MAG: CoA pyrophosphatase [Candidatus Marinimicrobia bacterium]|jgi:8-oxo-dGTP pyrophosphatase MutT (NUDIX family)|nr:coenzyme A pyrophosphatase [Candidatus Neomarinimicrobiota bacterium]MDP6499918.1 CoA pyrophosphatase [Candidatus Neomarinimicrobiota bacterium]MDP6726793.1 CoA pyrophosphatase [Candidatus Neomarinimicrobiota bacterium]|tara:strand:+ start:3023 stop:3655 length:633 start_codon:yes stop_codon:yes gene_type:complete
MELNKLSQKLQFRLKSNLPGQGSQWKMRVKTDKIFNFNTTEEDAIQSAVLILLYEKNGKIYFMLTERTETVDRHRGQISLPGGSREINEKLSSTATRETHEEIGINSDDIDVLGALSPLFVPVTGFIIHPFVGAINKKFELCPAPEEVAHIFSVDVDELIHDENELEERRNLRGYDMDIPYFLLSKHKVWGATAMILSEFKTVLKEVYDA